VEVADFNEQQVRSFATHWFVTVCANTGEGNHKAQEFLEQLFREENKAIQELVITPILLSLACAVAGCYNYALSLGFLCTTLWSCRTE
jgi:predicted NACHT family NTPase